MCCTQLAGNTGRKNSPSGNHRTTLSGCIFATKSCIDYQEKNLLNSSISSTFPHNMANTGPLMASICSGVWGTRVNFNRFLRLALVTAAMSLTGGQPNFARCLAVSWVGTLYTFSAALAPWRNFAWCKSCVLLYWQRYCTALQQRALAKLCGMVEGMELRNFRTRHHLHSAAPCGLRGRK